MRCGIIGCGAIANTIVNLVLKQDIKKIKLKYFYDRNFRKAKKLANLTNGTAVKKVEEMFNGVDLIIESASQEAVKEIVPNIISRGIDVLIMSVGALLDEKVRRRLIKESRESGANIYIPSGAIIGLDGVKAASLGKIKEIKLITRKSPTSLGVKTKKKEVVFKGKSSEAVKKFPVNINVAAALSLASGIDADVKIIADPEVEHNIHEVHVKGDFGEFKSITKNTVCELNPKTSVLAAYSAVTLLKILSDNIRVGT
ncbi:Aspartate dehydrogenase [Methanothermus fervidus DSM 2088]|uniref:L-aspartate dehydrogenase n=1 Tax=Methanothermus fervidus (strain ATCC 43054 / DSM 2088 / JCM 10308 / V24 S) TaxID=523846 RepID=E3GWN3_METFV|nr:aspartate dehydrogenase [Methanothermus fervidus]ADP76847.1 Aspartate dehydrogenase [Methanothermus fervidus DSM 2088]